MCQQNSGAPVVAWVTFPAASFSWISGEPGTYASSAHARRKFCATRGSYLVFTSTEPFAEVTPSLIDCLLLAARSLACALSQFLVFEALRRASGSTIAPLEFTSLAWAFIIQYPIWGGPPDAFVLLGALLIGSSGSIIISMEWRARAVSRLPGA